MKKTSLIGILMVLILITGFSIFHTRAENLNILGFSPQTIDMEIGSSFEIAVFADIVHEVDTVEITNFTWTAPGILNYSSCAQGQLFQGGVVYFDPDTPPGEYHNDIGWAGPITQTIILSSINNTNGTLGIITWNAIGVGNATLQIIEGKSIRNGSPVPTDFNTPAEIRIHPKPPKNFIAQRTSPNRVNISWIKGWEATHTVVIGNQLNYPTNINDGVIVYNGSNNYYLHNITQNQTWYYTAWSYAKQLYSITSKNAQIHPISYSLDVQIIGNGTVSINPLLPTYQINTTITLNAHPNAGWKFNYFQRNTPIFENPYIFNITENTSITLVFDQQQYTLLTQINGSGSINITPPGHLFPWNTSINLTAIPSTGWIFYHWSGDINHDTNPTNLIINDNLSIIAHFIPSYNLTINILGNGSVVLNPPGGKYSYNTSVTITAIPNQYSEFNYWSGALSGPQNPITLLIDGNKTINAHFIQPNYYLNISKVGNGTITKTPDMEQYPAGTKVVIAAQPDFGWRFRNWSREIQNQNASFTLTIDQSYNFDALFTIKRYTLKVNESGKGTITRSPNYSFYPHNSSVNLQATPAPGWEFDRWTRDITDQDPIISIRMLENKTIGAVFKQESSKPPSRGEGNGGSAGMAINNPPYAIININPSTHILINENITFDASKSWDPDGDNLEYLWKISNKKAHNGSIFKTSFLESGQYKVELIITDSNGLTANDSIIITVLKPNQPPSQPQIIGPSVGKSNTVLLYTISSNDVDNDKLKYTVNWGDTTIISSSYINKTITFSTSHQWSQSGLFQITVSAQDNATATSSSKAVLIDGIYVYQLGYILDSTTNQHYDIFFSNLTKVSTDLGFENRWYLLDENGNGNWDWRFDPLTMELERYNPTKSTAEGIASWIIVVFIMLIINGIVIVLYKKDVI